MLVKGTLGGEGFLKRESLTQIEPPHVIIGDNLARHKDAIHVHVLLELAIFVRLALQTDYAVRTLMVLATRQERVKIGDVAELFGISRDHVAKVVNQLARLGFVRSIRGAGGGIELGRQPDQISIGQVIVAFEGPMNLLDCVAMDNVCVIEKFCKLKGVLAEAERVQREYLESVSLADILPTKRQLTVVSISTK